MISNTEGTRSLRPRTVHSACTGGRRCPRLVWVRLDLPRLGSGAIWGHRATVCGTEKLSYDRDLWPGLGVRTVSVSLQHSHLTYTGRQRSPTPHPKEAEPWPRLRVPVGGCAWACSPSPLPSLLVNQETTKVAQRASYPDNKGERSL